MATIKIKKIILETSAGETFDLTLDELKDLYGELEPLFGKKTTECIYAEKD